MADAGNQGLLLLGGKQASKEATAEHPFGYGRERYIYWFIVAIVLFSVGGLFALYEAYHKCHEIARGPRRPRATGGGGVPLVVLGVAIVLESLSFRTAIIETNKIRGDASFAQFIRRAKPPELPVILLEDFAALLGLVFAFVAVSRHPDHREPIFDVAGTAVIGLLLVAVAVMLAIETKSLLLGEAADPRGAAAHPRGARGHRRHRAVIHMKTLHLGPEELLVAVKIGVARTDVGGRRRGHDRRRRARHPRRRADRPGHLPRARHLSRGPRPGRATRAAGAGRALSDRQFRSSAASRGLGGPVRGHTIGGAPFARDRGQTPPHLGVR